MWIIGQAPWGHPGCFVIGTNPTGACFVIDTNGNIQLARNMTISGDLAVNGNVTNTGIAAINTNANNAVTTANNALTTANNALTTATNLSNNIKTMYFSYPLYNGSITQFYKLGTLTLPQGGHQAQINLNLCYGYNISSGINAAQYKIQNYQLCINIYSSNGACSRKVDPSSFIPINDQVYNRTGIYYSGYVNVVSSFTNPLAVFMGLTTNPTNTVDIWMASYPWHGIPLVQVSQTAGSFDKSFLQYNSMPQTGWVAFDMIACTATYLYKNSNNIT